MKQMNSSKRIIHNQDIIPQGVVTDTTPISDDEISIEDMFFKTHQKRLEEIQKKVIAEVLLEEKLHYKASEKSGRAFARAVKRIKNTKNFKAIGKFFRECSEGWRAGWEYEMKHGQND